MFFARQIREVPKNIGIAGGGRPPGFLNFFRWLGSYHYIKDQPNGGRCFYRKIKGKLYAEKTVWLVKS